MSEMKSYCIFSKEAIKLMNGNRGKLASMAGHAYLHSWWDSYDKCWESQTRYHKHATWPVKYKFGDAAVKITLFVETTEELMSLYEKVKDHDPHVGVSLVVDAARTVFDGPTTVCFGYGPVPEEFVHEDIAKLKVLI